MRAVEPPEFRHLCGHFATGVVVLTAVDPEGKPAGMTANSFTSASLDPPLVSLNVDHQADMHRAMHRARVFAINVLGSGQEALSRHFAGNLPAKFDGVGYRTEDPGFVFLDGALATILCEMHSRFEAGDHTVFLGRVVGGQVAAGRPLLYYRGGYMTPGP